MEEVIMETINRFSWLYKSSWCSRISLPCLPRNLRSPSNLTTCLTYSAKPSVEAAAASNCPTRPNLNLTNSRTSKKCLTKEELLPPTLLGLSLLTRSTSNLRLTSSSKRMLPPILLESTPTCSNSTSSQTISLRIKFKTMPINNLTSRLIWLRISSPRCRGSRTPSLPRPRSPLTTCLKLISSSYSLAWTTPPPHPLLPNPTLLVLEQVTNLNSI
jgi:hypothetical protein